MSIREYRPEPGIALGPTPTPTPSSRGSAKRGWQIVQTHGADWRTTLSADLEGGADGVRLDLSAIDDVPAALDAADVRNRPVSLAHSDASVLDGLGEVAALDLGLETFCDRPFRDNVRFYTLDDARWHDAGANETQTLAITMATAIDIVRSHDARGDALPEVFAQITFRHSLPSRFFLAIAKLRAARRVWRRIAELCGVEADAFQTATAAWRETTLNDPWVNILRGTSGAFAGIVGGADRVEVPAYAAGVEAARLARNTQLILRDESHLGAVADPAGGAHALESLTDQLARATWSAFQSIEDQGGIHGGKTLVDKMLAESRGELERRVRHRRVPLLGVSRFPNLDESPVTPLEPDRPGVQRLAVPFEEFRAHRGRAAFVTLGPLAEHTHRTRFGVEVVESGGLVAIVDESCTTLQDGLAHWRQADTPIAVISCVNARFETDAMEAVKALVGAGATVWLLGNPGPTEEAFDDLGVRGFIFKGEDALSTLHQMWREVNR